MAKNAGRSYKAIRREKGKPDVTTHFPATASENDAIKWCEGEGYKVLRQEITVTPDVEKHISTTVVTVEPKVRTAKFKLREPVREVGQDEVRTVEEIRQNPAGEIIYSIQLGNEFTTRKWANESALEPARKK